MNRLEDRQDVITAIQHHSDCLDTIKRALIAREVVDTVSTESMLHEVACVMDNAIQSTKKPDFWLTDTADLMELAEVLVDTAQASILTVGDVDAEQKSLVYFRDSLDSLATEIKELADTIGNAANEGKDGAA